MQALDQYLQDHAQAFEEDLCQLLRIPSVSADSAHRADVRRAAQWVAGQFQGLGLTTEIVETPGHPIIYAESAAVPGAPTVLVYGHYDVQPPDPLDQWISPPFEPTRRDGNLYARGATDDKGQMLTHVKSTQAWLKTSGKLPVRLKFLIEGEEEVGSEHLEAFIDQQAKRLACDVAVISDTAQFGLGQPAITYGLKGISYFELRLTGPKQDLHSGTFGGAVTNPANALVRMLAALVNERGQVQVPGFYDDVVPLSEIERKQFAALGFRDDEFMKQLGVKALTGEEGYTTLERRWARPTCDINGLTSGYQGEGAKTVLPAKASAKFSFRLVPKQDPARLRRELEGFLRGHCPPGLEMELIGHHGAPGIVVPLDSPYIAAASRAIEHGFGRAQVFIREGGSIPVVATFRDRLGVDTLLLGWGLNDDNTHSPNEKFCLADFHRGIKASAYLWAELGRLHPSQRARAQLERFGQAFRRNGVRMLDRKFIIENAAQVEENCRRRGAGADVARFVALDASRRDKQTLVEDLNRQANEVSKSIGKAKDAAERDARKDQGRQLREQTTAAQTELDAIAAEMDVIQRSIPNMTHPDAPVGADDQANLEVRRGKTPVPKFDFKPLDHVDLGEKLELMDFKAGTKVAGHGFYFLKNEAVLLELALQRYALDVLVREGFTPAITPDLALNHILQGTGYIPRGPETQIYSIADSDLSLVATAEITLGGMLADEILDAERLPLKYCGISHCYRTEAGAHGRATRGLYRVHQFTKVEMFAFTLPEQSDAMLDQLCELECRLFDGLGIPYRVVDTATGDLGGPAYRKFDLEAWMPGRGEAGEYGEVTSTSNCTDYQARRLAIRYRTKGEKGTQFVHTLNGTAIAISRALIAILENYQQADGSIVVPEVLRAIVGKDRISR